MTRVLTDNDLTDPALVQRALRCMEQAFRDYDAGKMVSPPRHSVPFEDKGALVLTIGGSLGEAKAAGFRVYDRFHGDPARKTQAVLVWNLDTGELDGVVLGERVGKLRTGAIGALSARYMAREDAHVAAVLGTGPQARVQLECAAAVRDLREVRVFSRSEENRRSFATAMTECIGVNVTPVADARTAVDGADLIISATTSPVPVIDANWVAPGTHITMIGSKTARHHELPPAIGAMAKVVATDAPEQIHAPNTSFFLSGTEADQLIVTLSDIITGKAKGRHADSDITLFASGGLAGTEVLLAAEILRS